MAVEIIKVPDIGSSDPVDVIEISVKVGDTLAAEDTIVVLESDKATVEVPAPNAGVVATLFVKVGDRIREGDPLMEFQASSDISDADTTVVSAPSGDRPAGEQQDADGEAALNSSSPLQAAVKDERQEQEGQRQAQDQPVVVPDLGDIEHAELIEFSVSIGDTLVPEQVIAVLESDKASLEIPAPFAGVVTALTAKIGDQLSSGAALITVRAAVADSVADSVGITASSSSRAQTGSSQADASENKVASIKAADAAGARQNTVPPSSQLGKAVHAGPAVRKLARQLGVTLSDVAPSGPKSRILKDDVHAHVKSLLSTKSAAPSGGFSIDLPDIDFSKFGDVERVELNKIRRLTATNLHRSWLTIPHVTQHDEADISDLEHFRQQENKRLAKQGAKLTMLAFMVKACASALREFPQFNSSLEKSGQALITKHYINIGVAVETENGLVVPVLRNADKKGIVDIAIEVGELAEKARNKKLAPKDMQGGTFSISSLGGIGGTAFTPIVNWPEVAILGVSKSQMKPLWNGEAFEPRLMVPLSLSYDHRVIDGADAARFVAYLCSTLTDMRRALL